MSEQRPHADRLTIITPLGLRFYDAQLGPVVAEGLRVLVAPQAQPWRRVQLQPNRVGVYLAHNLPGMAPLSQTQLEAGPRTLYRVEVEDQFGRFLPCVFDLRLPQIGIARLACQSHHDVPLYSAPSRVAPAATAVIRAELFHRLADRPAAWALLEAYSGTTLLGRGLADAQGRVMLIAPYPALPRLAIGSPAGMGSSALTSQRWRVEFYANYAGLAPQPLPDLCAILQQPRAILLGAESPEVVLGPVDLLFGQELLVTTATSAQSLLLLDPALSPPA